MEKVVEHLVELNNSAAKNIGMQLCLPHRSLLEKLFKIVSLFIRKWQNSGVFNAAAGLGISNSHPGGKVPSVVHS